MMEHWYKCYNNLENLVKLFKNCWKTFVVKIEGVMLKFFKI